jgi:hypothetical protein
VSRAAACMAPPPPPTNFSLSLNWNRRSLCSPCGCPPHHMTKHHGDLPKHAARNSLPASGGEAPPLLIHLIHLFSPKLSSEFLSKFFRIVAQEVCKLSRHFGRAGARWRQRPACWKVTPVPPDEVVRGTHIVEPYCRGALKSRLPGQELCRRRSSTHRHKTGSIAHSPNASSAGITVLAAYTHQRRRWSRA